MTRRCYWCCIELRWWQLNACRQCGAAMRLDRSSPPVPFASRANAPTSRVTPPPALPEDGR